jgi:uncharacterized protein (TIGR04255 family)
MKVILTNKPLVEAIFELRWKLVEQAPGLSVDPNYSLLIGRMYERLSGEYPFHEKLPTASIPEEMAAYIVQHRFRKAPEAWPLVQLGPGIVTLNDTEDYDWDDFELSTARLVRTLFEAYSGPARPEVTALQLRYIDAMEFDYEAGDIFQFLRQHMKLDVSLQPDLFAKAGVARLPVAFDWWFSFRSTEPRGALHIRFARGEKRGFDALVWETTVRTEGADVPLLPDDIMAWAGKAHALTHSWFFEMIRGEELEGRFGLCMQ